MMDQESLCNLVDELRAADRESEWFEFKQNNGDPNAIAEYVSALANSAALHHKPMAYLAWGIDDKTHAVVGTSFKPLSAKISGQEMENWLSHQVVPPVGITFHEFDYRDGKKSDLRCYRSALRPMLLSVLAIPPSYEWEATRKSFATIPTKRLHFGRRFPQILSKKGSRSTASLRMKWCDC